MDEKKISRINELYHKSVETGLSAEEREEQKRLRREYIDAVRGNLRSQLENIVVVEEGGISHGLGPRAVGEDCPADDNRAAGDEGGRGVVRGQGED